MNGGEDEGAALLVWQSAQSGLQQLAQLPALDRHVRRLGSIGHLEASLERHQRGLGSAALHQEPPLRDGVNPGGECRWAFGAESGQHLEEVSEEALELVFRLPAGTQASHETPDHRPHRLEERLLGLPVSRLGKGEGRWVH